MREGQGIAGNQVGSDLFCVEFALHLVWGEEHNKVGLLDGLRDGKNTQPLCLGLRDGLGTRAQADADIDPGITQAQCMRMSLGAIADHGDASVLDDRQVGI